MRPQRLVPILGLFCLFGALATILFGINRTIDYSVGDEFLYLGLFQHPGENWYWRGMTEAHTLIHSFFHGFLGWTDAGLLTLRGARLVCVALGSLALSAGALSWARATGLGQRSGDGLVSFPVLLSVVGLGALYSYCEDFRALSYNSLTAFFLTISLAAFLAGLSGAATAGASGRRRFLAGFFAAGFAAGLLFFSKVPAGVTYIGCSSLFACLYLRHARERRGLSAVCLMALGAAVAVAFYFSLIQGWADWWRDLKEGGARLAFVENEHNPVSLLLSYAHNLFRSFLAADLYFLPSYVGLYLVLKGSRKKFPLVAALLTAAVFLIQASLLKHVFADRYRDHWTRPLLILMTAQLLALGLAFRFKGALRGPERGKLAPVALMTLFLLVLPFTFSIGTGINIMNHLAMCLTPWFLAIWILAALLARHSHPYVAAGSIVALLSVSSGQIALDHFSSMGHAVLAHTETIEGNQTLRHLRFTPDQKRAIEKLQATLRSSGFRDGDPLIEWISDARYIPLFVYMMNGVSPGFPRYANPFLLCSSIRDSKLTDLGSAYLLLSDLPEDRLDAKTLNCLREAGIRFPSAYAAVGHVIVDEAAEPKVSMTVYAPRQRIN